MKPSVRTLVSIRWLLAINLVVFTTRAVTAQCPGGSFSNAPGTYGAGQTVCISGAVNGAVTLNAGATMVVVNGGNFTGVIHTSAGASIQVQEGGRFAPNQANNFAASISNNGIVSGGFSVAAGASVSNNGTFTWTNSWNQNNPITVTNTACGTMTFSQNMNIRGSATINNNGDMIFNSGADVDNGAQFNNRGRLSFTQNVNFRGNLINYYRVSFNGGDLSSGNITDSIVNLGVITVAGSINSSIRIRNEGLMSVGGSYQINGQTIHINNSGAQLRVNGSFGNNGQVRGNGSLYVAGGINNNGHIRGYGAGAQRLVVNKTSLPGSNVSDINYNTGLAPLDPASYNPPTASPASCAVLPISMSTVSAVYNNNQTQLSWFTHAQSNARSFTIEYSQDGRTFTSVGELKAANGTNYVTTAYQYKHTPAVNGTVFYRVRENDLNGNVYFSNMVAVRTGNSLLISTEVFPNPFKDILQISMQLEKAGMIQVALYNASGQLVRKLQQQGLTGRNTIVMSSLSALLPGSYLVQIKAGDHISFEKLIK